MTKQANLDFIFDGATEEIAWEDERNASLEKVSRELEEVFSHAALTFTKPFWCAVPTMASGSIEIDSSEVGFFFRFRHDTARLTLEAGEREIESVTVDNVTGEPRNGVLMGSEAKELFTKMLGMLGVSPNQP